MCFQQTLLFSPSTDVVFENKIDIRNLQEKLLLGLVVDLLFLLPDDIWPNPNFIFLDRES